MLIITIIKTEHKLFKESLKDKYTINEYNCVFVVISYILYIC